MRLDQHGHMLHPIMHHEDAPRPPPRSSRARIVNPCFLNPLKRQWFNSEKGFGFITPADGSPDIFCHQSVIHAEGFRSLDEGEPVEFNGK